MPGIGDERDRIGEHPVGELHRNEKEVQADADGEGAAEARGGVSMAGPVPMGGIVRMIVMLVRAHGSTILPPCHLRSSVLWRKLEGRPVVAQLGAVDERMVAGATA